MHRKTCSVFDFVEVPEGTIAERCKVFCEKGKNDKNVNWVFANTLKFLQFQKERVGRKQITGGTLLNHVKTIKMFSEVTDIVLPCKKITSGHTEGDMLLTWANDA
jgi:hypothetical protein